jgi:hypothetical protein
MTLFKQIQSKHLKADVAKAIDSKVHAQLVSNRAQCISTVLGSIIPS